MQRSRTYQNFRDCFANLEAVKLIPEYLAVSFSLYIYPRNCHMYTGSQAAVCLLQHEIWQPTFGNKGLSFVKQSQAVECSIIQVQQIFVLITKDRENNVELRRIMKWLICCSNTCVNLSKINTKQAQYQALIMDKHFYVKL